MKTLDLNIERTKEGMYFGRVLFEDDLIVEEAETLEEVQNGILETLAAFHDVNGDDIQFNVIFDLTALFEQKKFLNISAIAQKAGINASLMRQYAAGIKFPSLDKAKEIEKIMHGLGQELLGLSIGLSSMKPEPKTRGRKKRTA